VPSASASMVIDLSSVSGPSAPSNWTINVQVNLKLPDGSTKPAPAGSVLVELYLLPDMILKQQAKVDSYGRVQFTNVSGAYYNWMAFLWLPTWYNIKATHLDTKKVANKNIKLDSQIPDTGVFKFPWEPFPWSESDRKWSDPEPLEVEVEGGW